MKRIVKKWCTLGAGTLILLCLVWWGHPFLLTQIAAFLVVDDPLIQSADVIITTSGSLSRIEYAVALYHQGFGRALLINLDDPYHDDTLLKFDTYGWLREMLITNGVPKKAIVFELNSSSTFEDALQSRGQIARHGWQSAIVVSHPLHMRRVAWSFRKAFSGYPITLMFKAIPSSNNAEYWWTRERGLVTVNNEFIKLFYYWLKYG